MEFYEDNDIKNCW